MMINMAVIKPIWHWAMDGVVTPSIREDQEDDVRGCHSVRMTSETSGIFTSALGDNKDTGWFFKYLTRCG